MPSPPPVTIVQKHGRIEGLDLLRLVAALSVVAFHYTFRGAAADSLTSVSLPAVTPVTKYAYLGVQMFFVISGFVIAYSAEGRTAREFFIARAARIYPGFLVCMTATFVVTLAFGMPRFETSAGQWLANLFIFSPALGHKFMDGVYWSIVYELIFYGWAFALILFGVFARKVTLIVILWLAISVVNEMLVGSIALRLLFLTDESGFFCAGMLLYAVYADRVGRLTLPLLAISTFAGAAQSVLHVNWVRGHYHEAFSDTVTASVCVGAVALVGLCLLPKRIPLPGKLVGALGGLTYPLYLLHQQIGCIAFNEFEGLVPNGVLIVAVVLAMLLASFVVWRFAERPGQRFVKSLLRRLLQWPFAWQPKRRQPIAPTAVFGPIPLPRAARP